MPKSRRQDERTLYPVVASWLRRYRKCFRTSINTGLRHGRIDVLGVRDVGGDLSGEIETISIEVKRGAEPFATATGQALGYRVYANRIYLADLRDIPFTHEENEIAGHLGVGLIRIKANKCHEELSSPYYKLITRMNLLLIERLALGICQFCGTVFETGDGAVQKKFSKLARENLKKALTRERGLMFWNRELAARKHKLGIRSAKDGGTFERRFICPDCVSYVFTQFTRDSEE